MATKLTVMTVETTYDDATSTYNSTIRGKLDMPPYTDQTFNVTYTAPDGLVPAYYALGALVGADPLVIDDTPAP